MPSSDIFYQFGQLYSADETAQVLTALRQDSLVWDSLKQPDFLQSALERAVTSADDETQDCGVHFWSPGRLALLALGDPRPVEALRSEPMALLGPGLQELALQAYQALQRSGRAPATLRDAALLALMLRERRRLTGSWAGMFAEILMKHGPSETVWRAPLAVLYGIIPDPEELLRSLMVKNAPRAAVAWAVHAQLSQPVTETEHTQVLGRLMQGLPVASQLQLLRALSLQGRERLAAALADRLVIGHPAFSNLRAQTGTEGGDLEALATRALALQQMGAFYQLAGDGGQAHSLFSAAQTTLEQWQAGLRLQRINLHCTPDAAVQAGAETDPLADSAQTAQLAAASGWLGEDLGAVIISHPFASEVISQISPEDESPLVQIKRSAVMSEKEPALARDLARQGASGLLEEIRQGGLPFQGDFVTTWQPQDALKVLVNLDLRSEALEAAQALLTLRPVDIALLRIAQEICERQGLIEQSIWYTANASALEPRNLNWHRDLGRLWGKANRWEKARAEWQSVLDREEQPSTADKLSCANAALKASCTDQTIAICESVLEENDNNGWALGLMGQALLADGEAEEALGYLVRATMLTPEALEPWLALARAQHMLGEPIRALDTLRSAVTAVPDAPEAHLDLSLACINAGLLADALPHLKKAFNLAPENPEAALHYGQTLRRLGHTNEARSVFERSRSLWSECIEMAYEYALTLLDLGMAEQALPVLENALRSGLMEIEAYLLYARILLGDYRASGEAWSAELRAARMQQAEAALRQIIEIDPNNLEARFLEAAILRERGDLHAAMEAYRSLSELPEVEASDMQWRIQWGLGRTALRLGEIGTALVAIKEACQLRPDNLPMQRTLAEVSAQANLPQQALEAAEAVIQLVPGDVENLSWYASFVASIGEANRAVDALEQAVQIDPQRPDLLAALAHWQLSAGDLDAARASLQTLESMGNAARADLRKAAQIYLRLQDEEAALKCFERALKISPEVPADLLYEAAQLYERMGKTETALELADRALDETPDNLSIALLQSDLLAVLKRPQAALAVLERSLRAARGDGEETLTSQRCRILGDIHERFTRLLAAEGSLAEALDHAEKAFNLNLTQPGRCYLAADLSLAMLQPERAARTVRIFPNAAGKTMVETLLDLDADGLNLLCLRIEQELSGEASEETSDWIDAALDCYPNEARLLAARARMLAYKGETAQAQRWFQSALKAHAQAAGATPHWLAEAALAVEDWREAVRLFEQSVHERPNEARAQLGLARALTLSAERQRLCETLHCQKNAPGKTSVDEVRRNKFEDAIQAAGKLADVAEVSRWLARGQVIFAPTAQNTRALATMPSRAEDTAALVAALRGLNNRAAAIQIARKYADHPLVLLQAAVCYLSEPSKEGLAAAEQAVQANGGQPLAYAVLAMIASQCNEPAKALEAYENALTIWPDEPMWHDAAGDLCIQSGNIQAGMLHRKQAAALDQRSALYAFKLGQIHLANDEIDEAIACLEKSVGLDDARGEVWLALATAYHIDRQLPQALEAAKHASDLLPSSADGLLIGGETALAMDKVDMALEFARDAARREPENPLAVLFLSNVLVLRGRVEEGLAVIEASSPTVKSQFPTAFERARLIHRLYGPQAALELLEKLVRDFPEEPGLLGFLATTEAECGEFKAAERNAFKSLQLDPNQPELTLMLGRLMRKTGQLDQAIHLLSEAVKMAPDSLETLLELGSVYQERREFLLALQVYQQAMRVAPKDYQAYYHSGLILRDSKDYSTAESMLRKAADLAPENPTIRRQLVGVITLNLVHNKQEATI